LRATRGRLGSPHDIWREDINRRGGLLGLPVEFVCYDDRADASLVPGIYERLMGEDKVDLVIGGYGTNTLLPAMPLIMERKRFFVGLMGLGVNNALAYPNYFAMIPTGPDPNPALTEGFFALAAEQSPRPATVALVSADAEFSRNPILGAGWGGTPLAAGLRRRGLSSAGARALERRQARAKTVELQRVHERDKARLFTQAGQARVVLQKSQPRIAGQVCPIQCIERRPHLTQCDVHGRQRGRGHIASFLTGEQPLQDLARLLDLAKARK
jgi:hypothetical protein